MQLVVVPRKGAPIAVLDLSLMYFYIHCVPVCLCMLDRVKHMLV